jgi:hypothetical protein
MTQQPKSQTHKPPKLKSLSPTIYRLLNRLRSRLRRFVFLEGICLIVIWGVLTFWAALAVDYLPVKFGLAELSRPARIVVLVLIGMLLAWLIFRVILRRVFVRMKDSSMALLIEKRCPEFNESLITTVNQTLPQPMDVNVDTSMLDRTREAAERLVPDVDLRQVLNSWPLKKGVVAAVMLLMSLVGFGLIYPDAIKLAGKRLYLLDATPWPRTCRLEVMGMKVKRENPVEGIEELGQIVPPVNGEFRIAKGSALTLMVRAETDEKNGVDSASRNTDSPKLRLPSSCTLQYQTSDGGRGSQAFKRVGAPRDGFQLYTLDEQPLQGILSDLSFHIRGGDHRLGPFKITVVDEPNVVETKLACEFPPYIVDETSLRWTNRTVDWSGQARLPQGTKITVAAKSNKPLKKVYAIDPLKDGIEVIEPTGDSFEFAIGDLEEAANVQFYLCDTDGIVSELAHTVSIDGIEDQPPSVQTALSGIGTAVTPDVKIPFSGKVQDDYGLKRTWIEIEVDQSEILEEEVEPNVDGELEAVVDFKLRKQQKGEKYELPVGDESTVALVVRSEDKFNLREDPNIGMGDRYVLDVVSSNELVRILERSEVGQRRRLEQIYLEMVDARNYLVRTKSKRAEIDEQVVEPGEDLEPGESEGEQGDELRKQELRLLFSQRGMLQVDKSRMEILGCAEAFDNIRLQLINNRIDSEDRKKRFNEQIIGPLRLIGGEGMQQLRDQIEEVESKLRDLQQNPDDENLSGSADQFANVAIEQTDEVLKQLDEVLNVLIKYETQNELLDIVRKMIKDQQELMDRTKKERQQKAFEGLLDLE